MWKSRNDCLFQRKKGYPLQVHQATLAINACQALLDKPKDNHFPDVQDHSTQDANHLPLQGSTLKSDLLLAGIKVFSDAAFRCCKIPGKGSSAKATGVGLYIDIPDGKFGHQIQIQASAPITNSPLQAEALALVLAAKIAHIFQLKQASFLTDCLPLAKAAASRRLDSDDVHWTIRHSLAEFFSISIELQPSVYHISRKLNGIADNVAHQVLNSSAEPVFGCNYSAHRHSPCPFISRLSQVHLQDFVIHAVLCI